MNATVDPLARFASAGKHLSAQLREEVLSLGHKAIPGLLRFIKDEDLWAEDSPGSGWPPIHAVELLAALKATEAVEPMLDAMSKTTWDEILHDRLIGHLPELGAAVLEPALARLTPDATEDVRSGLCCVLAKIGVKDERIYLELCRFFSEDQLVGSGCLADYGDPAALPLIAHAIETFEPDFERSFGVFGLGDLIEAHERLGTPLGPELRAHADRLFAEFAEHRRALTERSHRATEKVGRNDPCPCGSGMKFKKCCLGRRTEQGSMDSKDANAEVIKVAQALVDTQRRGPGPAQQIADFAKPLLDDAEDQASLENAMNLGTFFWNLALCGDEKARTDMLDDLIRTQSTQNGTYDAPKLRTLAAMMIDRHRHMFPDLHRKEA